MGEDYGECDYIFLDSVFETTNSVKNEFAKFCPHLFSHSYAGNLGIFDRSEEDVVSRGLCRTICSLRACEVFDEITQRNWCLPRGMPPPGYRLAALVAVEAGWKWLRQPGLRARNDALIQLHLLETTH